MQQYACTRRWQIDCTPFMPNLTSISLSPWPTAAIHSVSCSISLACWCCWAASSPWAVNKVWCVLNIIVWQTIQRARVEMRSCTKVCMRCCSQAHPNYTLHTNLFPAVAAEPAAAPAWPCVLCPCPTAACSAPAAHQAHCVPEPQAQTSQQPPGDLEGWGLNRVCRGVCVCGVSALAANACTGG